MPFKLCYYLYIYSQGNNLLSPLMIRNAIWTMRLIYSLKIFLCADHKLTVYTRCVRYNILTGHDNILDSKRILDFFCYQNIIDLCFIFF